MVLGAEMSASSDGGGFRRVRGSRPPPPSGGGGGDGFSCVGDDKDDDIIGGAPSSGERCCHDFGNDYHDAGSPASTGETAACVVEVESERILISSDDGPAAAAPVIGGGDRESCSEGDFDGGRLHQLLLLSTTSSPTTMRPSHHPLMNRPSSSSPVAVRAGSWPPNYGPLHDDSSSTTADEAERATSTRGAPQSVGDGSKVTMVRRGRPRGGKGSEGTTLTPHDHLGGWVGRGGGVGGDAVVSTSSSPTTARTRTRTGAISSKTTSSTATCVTEVRYRRRGDDDGVRVGLGRGDEDEGTTAAASETDCTDASAVSRSRNVVASLPPPSSSSSSTAAAKSSRLWPPSSARMWGGDFFFMSAAGPRISGLTESSSSMVKLRNQSSHDDDPPPCTRSAETTSNMSLSSSSSLFEGVAPSTLEELRNRGRWRSPPRRRRLVGSTTTATTTTTAPFPLLGNYHDHGRLPRRPPHPEDENEEVESDDVGASPEVSHSPSWSSSSSSSFGGGGVGVSSSSPSSSSSDRAPPLVLSRTSAAAPAAPSPATTAVSVCSGGCPRGDDGEGCGDDEEDPSSSSSPRRRRRRRTRPSSSSSFWSLLARPSPPPPLSPSPTTTAITRSTMTEEDRANPSMDHERSTVPSVECPPPWSSSLAGRGEGDGYLHQLTQLLRLRGDYDCDDRRNDSDEDATVILDGDGASSKPSPSWEEERLVNLLAELENEEVQRHAVENERQMRRRRRRRWFLRLLFAAFVVGFVVAALEEDVDVEIDVDVEEGHIIGAMLTLREGRERGRGRRRRPPWHGRRGRRRKERRRRREEDGGAESPIRMLITSLPRDESSAWEAPAAVVVVSSSNETAPIGRSFNIPPPSHRDGNASSSNEEEVDGSALPRPLAWGAGTLPGEAGGGRRCRWDDEGWYYLPDRSFELRTVLDTDAMKLPGRNITMNGHFGGNADRGLGNEVVGAPPPSDGDRHGVDGAGGVAGGLCELRGPWLDGHTGRSAPDDAVEGTASTTVTAFGNITDLPARTWRRNGQSAPGSLRRRSRLVGGGQHYGSQCKLGRRRQYRGRRRGTTVPSTTKTVVSSSSRDAEKVEASSGVSSSLSVVITTTPNLFLPRNVAVSRALMELKKGQMSEPRRNVMRKGRTLESPSCRPGVLGDQAYSRRGTVLYRVANEIRSRNVPHRSVERHMRNRTSFKFRENKRERDCIIFETSSRASSSILPQPPGSSKPFRGSTRDTREDRDEIPHLLHSINFDAAVAVDPRIGAEIGERDAIGTLPPHSDVVVSGGGDQCVVGFDNNDPNGSSVVCPSGTSNVEDVVLSVHRGLDDIKERRGDDEENFLDIPLVDLVGKFLRNLGRHVGKRRHRRRKKFGNGERRTTIGHD